VEVPHLAAARERLENHPAVAELGLRKGELRLTVEDEWITETARQLELGEMGPMRTDDLLDGRPVTVCFCDVNATKALHAGHLRNAALGIAVSAIAAAAGGTVSRRSNVNDLGRSMGEAIAGYELFADDPRGRNRGGKGDHLVGECYARYVEQIDRRPQEEAVDETLQREAHSYDDRAEELLNLLAEGDPAVVGRWRVVRELVMEGQAETLARLGVEIDTRLYESDFIETIERVSAAGLESGLFSTTEDGATVFRARREDHPQLLLARPDGFPTQHLRYVSLWTETAPRLAGALSIEIMGDEWTALGEHGDTIMRRLSPDVETHPRRCLFNGLVTVGEGVIHSSDGPRLLVDELLDTLTEAPRVRKLAASHGEEAVNRFAAMLLLGYCLTQAPRTRLPFGLDRVLSSRHNPTWAIAQAIAGAAGEDPAAGSPNPADPALRALVLQSQLHRQFLAKALESDDPTLLYTHNRHLAEWYAGEPSTPELRRVARTVFAAGAAALGLWR
jgi:arginyl-tRNA synthetase